jgi:hypothetical protein
VLGADAEFRRLRGRGDARRLRAACRAASWRRRGRWGCAGSTILRRIWLPQAVQRALPTLGGETVLQLKATPLVATITVVDVYAVAGRVRQDTFIVYEPLLLLALVYLIDHRGHRLRLPQAREAPPRPARLKTKLRRTLQHACASRLPCPKISPTLDQTIKNAGATEAAAGIYREVEP